MTTGRRVLIPQCGFNKITNRDSRFQTGSQVSRLHAKHLNHHLTQFGV